jgi:flagellar hook-length control protein FliK
MQSRSGFTGNGTETGTSGGSQTGVSASQGVERTEPKPVRAMDAGEFADRVMKFVHASVDREQSSLQMRLHPPELGSVRLTLSVKEGEVRLAMETSTEAARQVITQNLDTLRNTLVQQGYEVGRMDVSLAGSFSQPQNADRELNPGRPTGNAAAGPAEAESVAEDTPVARGSSARWHIDLVA